MKIGVELGWRALRTITVGAQNEILSVNDVAQPAVVSTPPIVALSGGGALVGQAAIDLIQDEQQAGNLVTIGHALADLGDSNHSPELLAILLEKIGRDIEGFGSTRSNVTFIVSEDIIGRGEDGDTARRQLAKAAAWAHFKNPSLLYRVEAAAREGLDAYTTTELDALTIGTLPVVRTLVIDAGPLSLSASTLGIVFKENRHVGPKTERALWTEPQAAPPEGQAEEQSTALSLDMFRHFAQTVEAQTHAKFGAPVMDRIWELVRSPHSPPFQPIIDSVGIRHLFDVNHCRRKLADAVRRELPGLLADFRTSSNDSFIIIGGQYASIAEVNEAIRDVCKQWLGPTLHFTELPGHGVAGAVRFEDLSPLSLEPPKDLPPLPKSLDDIQGKPINDGELHRHPQDQKKNNGPLGVSEPKLLEPIVSSTPFDLTKGVDEAGKQVGVFWVEKIDRLLRLRGTAPSVGLKEYYERHLKKAGIAETVQRAASDGVASWWERLFGTRPDGDANASPSKLYLKPAIVDGLVMELQELAGKIVFDKASAKTNIEKSFKTATEFRDAEQLTAADYFAPYVNSQRRGVVPEATILALFNGHGWSGAKRPAGISVSDQVILTDSGVAPTHLSGHTRHHTLGYASEGFRSLLVSSSRTVRRWQFMPWFRWLMGGHVSLVQLIGVVALFGVVLTLSGMSIVRALQPTLLHASIDRGVLACKSGDDTSVPLDVTCTGSTEASFGANATFHDGCYLNVLRLVLPGSNLGVGVNLVSGTWSPVIDDADLVCQEAYSFDMKDVLRNNADNLTAAIRSVAEPDPDPLPDPDPDPPEGDPDPLLAPLAGDPDPLNRSVARRSIFFGAADPANPSAINNAQMIDIAWISAAPDAGGIPLGNMFKFVVPDHQFSNPRSSVSASHVCVDIGARLNIVAIGSGEKPADQLASIVRDGPGNDLKFLRFALTDERSVPPINQSLADMPLFSPIMPQVAGQNPGTEAIDRPSKLQRYPRLHHFFRKPAPLGFGRDRLMGACTK